MITLVTSNNNKRKEIEAILKIPLSSVSIDLPEIQSMNLEEVVRAKAAAAFERVGAPVIVEDVGVEIEALNNFPGPLAKWWEKTVGYDRTLELVKGRSQRIRGIGMACYTDGSRTVVAQGAIEGQLAPRAGEDGFGFDFYMIPDGYNQTLAQLGRAVKNKISHRVHCFQQLHTLLREHTAVT
ncbi:non-canonical purine NTP pyrophosphatase [Candidatus Uhrbacteria bacterium]|nr:non-canonical purine NTP pyrophosphatase [Candidatus Uhrbacteria bacterium]